jgi:hypothetical protein
MSWHINYALENIDKDGSEMTAEHLSGDFIRISYPNRPDVVAAISAAHNVDAAVVASYHQAGGTLDFVCGYRKTCIWGGDAISYAESNRFGWGNFGTLTSAVMKGDAETASHKVYFFCNRLLQQYGSVSKLNREYDRVYRISLKSGSTMRLAMVDEYDPTADIVRSYWEQFGPVDIMWNINPNGRPTTTALSAGEELGCKIVKTEDMKRVLQSR